MKKRVVWVAAGIILALAAYAVYLNIQVNAAMNAEEISEMIEDRYDGEVLEIALNRQDGMDVYEIELLAQGGVYFVQLAGEDGAVQNIELLEIRDDQADDMEEVLNKDTVKNIVEESIEEEGTIIELQLLEGEGRAKYEVMVQQEEGIGTFEIDARTGELLLYTLEETTRTEPITEERAKEIALSEVEGEVDDVDLEQQNGRLVYEVEVENDDLDIEADVIIDAFTEEIIEIIWDD
ncbi:PepSY domain-containing protein [Alteribacter populi]|uniref:PepSY domain-containing protein n=1 Tax=Alteribacter populi TaxID=2011011 RepID=UPI000BBA74F4|nr:PepSY domain-containing protein [Alteribacter populi]